MYNLSFFSHRIHWKNDPPAKNEQYKPTSIEHKANILTHGVSLFDYVLFYTLMHAIFQMIT